MTGYGEGREEDEEIEIYLQIKTLNHRFLEVEIYPSQFIPFIWEKKIKEYIKEKIKRGKVILNVEIKRKKLPLPKILINRNLIFHYHKILSQISSELGLKDRVSLSHILSLPEIIYLRKEEEINKENTIVQILDNDGNPFNREKQLEKSKTLQKLSLIHI